MIGFIHNASWTRHHAIGEIVSIGAAVERKSGAGEYHEATLRSGETIYLDGLDVDRLNNPIVATIPAKDGVSVIHAGADQGEDWVYREPVLAWQVTSLGEMIPLTIRGPNDGMMRCVPVEKPDGEVWDPDNDAVHKSLDAYLRSERDARERKQAERPQRAADQGEA